MFISEHIDDEPIVIPDEKSDRCVSCSRGYSPVIECLGRMDTTIRIWCVLAKQLNTPEKRLNAVSSYRNAKLHGSFEPENI